MKKIQLITSSILLFLFTNSQSFAQSSFGINAGAALPLSDFGSENPNNEDAGGAATGFSLGLKYTYQFSENGVGLFAGVDFNYNGLTKDVKRDTEDAFEDLGILGADYKFFSYINIPISAGLNYKYDASENVSLFVNGGIALNLMKVTDFEIELGGDKISTEYDLATSVGFRAGAGVLFSEKISVAFDYYGLGNHDINGRARGTGVPSEDVDVELAVNILTIRVGYTF